MNHVGIQFGAPSIAEAVAAAEEEFAFTESLCKQPADTLTAVHRSFEGRRDPRGVPHAAPEGRARA